MKKNKKLKNTFLLFAIVFTLFGIIVTFFTVDHFKKINIANNGIAATATVTPKDITSSTDDDGVTTYSIKYSFLDENGNIHYGKTGYYYSLYEAQIMVEKSEIQIKYDPNTFESVLATYKEDNKNAKYLILFSIIFPAIGVVMFIAFLCVLKRESIEKKVMKNGFDYIASIVSYKSNISIDEIPYYYITYTWTDEYNTVRKGVSGSIFTIEDVKSFLKMQDFKIRAIGKHSAILSTPQELEIKYEEIQSQDPNIITCEHCSTRYNKSLERCPKCGSSKIDTNIF